MTFVDYRPPRPTCKEPECTARSDIILNGGDYYCARHALVMRRLKPAVS